jgi:hypothetical protein
MSAGSPHRGAYSRNDGARMTACGAVSSQAAERMGEALARFE